MPGYLFQDASVISGRLRNSLCWSPHRSLLFILQYNHEACLFGIVRLDCLPDEGKVQVSPAWTSPCGIAMVHPAWGGSTIVSHACSHLRTAIESSLDADSWGIVCASQTHSRSSNWHIQGRIPDCAMCHSSSHLQLQVVSCGLLLSDVEMLPRLCVDMLSPLYLLKYSTVLEVLWSFSIYLEAVAILPQLMMLQRTGEAETITTHYLFALGMYRGLYIPNWIYRYFADDTVDPIAVVAGVVQTVLYGDFFYSECHTLSFYSDLVTGSGAYRLRFFRAQSISQSRFEFQVWLLFLVLHLADDLLACSNRVLRGEK